MNILLHCVYFPPEVGGLESHVYYLARALVRRGHRVDVVTSRSLPGVAKEEEMEGIRVWRTWFPARNSLGWIAHALGSVPRTRSLAVEADVIHAQAFASVLPGAAARRSSGAPLVATFHTSHFLTRAARSPRGGRSWQPWSACPTTLWPPAREIAAVAECAGAGHRPWRP